MARRFRYEYGSGPLHLVGVAAAFSVAGWALVEIFATLTADERRSLAPKLKQKAYERDEAAVEPGLVPWTFSTLPPGAAEPKLMLSFSMP